MDWIIDSKIIIGIDKTFKFYPSIIIFSLFNTLINKKYKKMGSYGWEPKYDNIKNVLKKSNSMKTSIIIIENIYKDAKFEYMKDIIELFKEEVNVNLLCLFPLVRNNLMKPFTGSYKLLENIYKKHNSQINKKNSVVVGSNAGRYNYYGDKNCVDRSFAFNLKIDFALPEQLFLNSVYEYSWKWNILMPHNDEMSIALTERIKWPKITNFVSSKNSLIIIMGQFSCGKTYFINKISDKNEDKINIIDLYTENKDFITDYSELLNNAKINIICLYSTNPKFVNNIITLMGKYYNERKFKTFIYLNTPINFCRLFNSIKVELNEQLEINNGIIYTNYEKFWIKNKENIKKKLLDYKFAYINFDLNLDDHKYIHYKF